ncbi:unnamed protein product [Caenorhabditis auriculariae]|uniref:Uncharacterized protein n=1 Tax=Caenorhabditis auriculariae TaxID=2777116 RepID=A0A8S1H2E4_9PELO|nr:unnamed protein product [Caenorhabditis auriculariae]
MVALQTLLVKLGVQQLLESTVALQFPQMEAGPDDRRCRPDVKVKYVAEFRKGMCEADGSCRHCADNRYSYYRCRVQDDCFIGETCDDGFCCPNPLPNFSLQREQPKNGTQPPNDTDQCPDGSPWSKRFLVRLP